jgi:hypothetical protein
MLLIKLRLGQWQTRKVTSVAKIKYRQGEFEHRYAVKIHYLQHEGEIRITGMNSTGLRIPFYYPILDDSQYIRSSCVTGIIFEL